MTKKLIAIITSILLIVSLCACNDTPNEEDTSGKTIIIQPEETTGADETEQTANTGDATETETESETENPDQIKNPGEYTYTDIETPETVYVLSANGAATLRKEDYTQVTSLANGAALERTGVSTDADGFWSRVVYEDNVCYIASHLITTLADLDEGFTEVSKTLTKADGSLKIRIAPDMNSEVTGYFSAGQEITVIAENIELGWYKVEFVPYGATEKATGYIVANPEYFVPDETDAATETETETETEAESATEA